MTAMRTHAVTTALTVALSAALASAPSPKYPEISFCI